MKQKPLLITIAAAASFIVGCDRQTTVTTTQPESVPAQAAQAAPAPAPAAPVAGDGVVVAEDGYMYYPDYQVYYNRSRHEYHYREGNVWVTHSTPGHFDQKVVMASPSVHVDFHDAPDRHHEEIERRYPKHWTPSPHDRRDDHH